MPYGAVYDDKYVDSVAQDQGASLSSQHQIHCDGDHDGPLQHDCTVQYLHTGQVVVDVV